MFKLPIEKNDKMKKTTDKYKLDNSSSEEGELSALRINLING